MERDIDDLIFGDYDPGPSKKGACAGELTFCFVWPAGANQPLLYGRSGR